MDITLRRRVFFLASLILACVIVWPLKTPVAAGIAFAFVSERPAYWLTSKVRAKRKLARWAAAGVFVVFVYALFLVPLVSLLYTTIADFVTLAAQGKITLSLPDLSSRGASLINRVFDTLGIDIPLNDVLQRLTTAVSQASQGFVTKMGQWLSATPQIIFHTLVMLVVWVFFLVDGRHWRQVVLPLLIPWDRERTLIAKTTADVLAGAITANVLVSLAQALVIGIVFMAVQLPNALVWTIFGFFSSFVPMLGTALVMFGAAIFFFVMGSTTKGIVIIACSFLVGMVDNVMRPFLMKGDSELKFFWLFLSFIGGVEVFGVAGLVLGPLFFAYFKAFLQLYQDKTPSGLP